jgi:putative addiction module component (TIGR02574 family)
MVRPAVDITTLSRDEKLELLHELWSALERDPDALPLSDDQRRDLDERLDALEREGPIGLTWDETVAKVRSAR